MKKTRKQIERESSTIFKVPNTAEGEAFIRQLRKYATAGVRIRARGRGPRRCYGYDKDFLPKRLAHYFGIYIDKPMPTGTLISMQLFKQVYQEVHGRPPEIKETPEKLTLECLQDLWREKRAITVRNA